VRKAHADVFKILREQRFDGGGIVHAFSGGVEEAKMYAKLGFKLGVGGSVTYEQAKRLHNVVAAMPIESLVIETDAPDMIPQPYRQSRTPILPVTLLRICQVYCSGIGDQ
jgi:TatD DNase family protein